jgi:hypothetical protein
MKTIMEVIQGGRKEGSYVSSAAVVALENVQKSKQTQRVSYRYKTWMWIEFIWLRTGFSDGTLKMNLWVL